MSAFRDISRDPNVPKSTPELETDLNACQNPEQLREVLLNSLAAQGQVIRTQDDSFNNRLVIQPQTPDASLPANGFRYEKELTFDPESGRRNLMLRANTMEDLAALEAQILGY